MAEIDIFSAEFTRKAEAAWDRARSQALARGVPVFYRNDRTGSRSWSSRTGAASRFASFPVLRAGRNFEIVRELARTAA